MPIVNIENNIIENSDTDKFLGVLLDNELKFDKHVENLCKKASQKLHALARISKYVFEAKTHYNEIFYKFTIWLLSNCMDVS